ncbi:forespore capture DNA-binding protein RefZ [Virgibacillus dakarensis]|uniref:TetR family transcriptional regulator n=1 Tax=Lentibacillus populi TaxID=1827502 RepID=A0A9W5TTJ4_9BACI|nr:MULTISPECIES: forespore capture DNA-binding protein RefZ [Bacillaceae]MBT2216599.1 forespore capture DNA-binding protein RefZ [Virgibacillus dakarensis]MTW84321.1 forespore capture DNA-binding protein RefZ [Virgibacillus dakarensis]GGB27302.1 TetR family transcriptional regulator [Lentibacillus populi]
MKNNPSKQKVIDAASSLFFQKGFHGTSVRDIADKACVNVSLISYYFKSKQGLLEHGVTQYYETYLKTIEDTLQQSEHDTELSRLKKLIETIIQYRQNNHQFSCFILRELSLDSVFVREMAVTYIAKENYYISNAFFAILGKHKKQELDRQFLLMQLKGMLITPYILQNEWKNQVIGEHSHQMFVRKYVQTIHEWLDFIVAD